MRRIAKLLPYLVIALVLAIAAVFLLRSGPLASRLREALVQELKQRTGREVSLGALAITGPGRLTLRDLTVRDPDGAAILSVPEIAVRTGGGGWLARIRTVGDIKEITLHRPVAHLVRQPTGAWDLSDLLQNAKGETRFTGKVKVEDGAITLTDQMKGGLVTALVQVDLTTVSDSSGRTRFTLTAVGSHKAFGRLQLRGQHDPASSTTVLSGTVTDLPVAYALQRLPPTRSFAIPSGRADVTGTVTIGPTAKPLGFVPDLHLRARGVQLAFPWLRRPLTSVAGRFRLTGQQIVIESAAARLEDAPVTVRGTITGFRNPQLDLDCTATGVTPAQAKALHPGLTLPTGLTLLSPVQVAANARGLASEVAVRGRVSAKEALLGCVPWHDLVADFAYTRGRLDITNLDAHGSPQRLEGDIHLRFGPGGEAQTQAALVLRDVPVKVLVGCMPELGAPEVGGTATVTLDADLRDGGAVTGSFVGRGIAYHRYPLGTVRADFALVGQEIRIENGTVAGPMGTGRFTLVATRAGRYDLSADLSAVDLAALEVRGLTGKMQGSFRLAGSLKGGGSGRVSLTSVGPGPIRALSAELGLAPGQLTVSDLVLQARRGQVTGRLKMQDADLAGQLEVADLPVREWLPVQYRPVLPSGQASGSISIDGTVSAPGIRADLRIESLSLPGLGQGVSRAQLRYRGGVLSVDDLTFENQGNRITLQGEYSHARGFDVQVAESRTDLAVLSLWTRPWWGLTLAGPATINATLRGRTRRPEVAFQVIAPTATINDQPVEALAVTGSVRNGVLSLDTGRLRQGDGHLEISGTVELASNRMDLEVAASQINLAVFSFWTRPRLGLDLSGLFTAEASVSGLPINRQASFRMLSGAATVNELPFRDLELTGRLDGGLLTLDKLALQQDDGALHARGTVDLRAKQLDLSLGLNSIAIYNFMLVFARAASRLSYFRTTDAFLHAYTGVPGPLSGRLTSGIEVKGTYESFQVAADVSLEKLSFSGGTVDSVSGNLGMSFHRGTADAVSMNLVATQGEDALVEVAGEVVPSGEAKLQVDVSYLDLSVLEPWIKPLSGLSGKATAHFNLSGRTSSPVLQGGVFVEQPKWGPLKFEAAVADPIALERDVLTIEHDGIRLTNGPMQAKGRATIPLRISFRPFRVVPLPTAVADLSISGGSFAPLTGMTPAQFDADLHLADMRIVVRKSADPASPDFRVPGLRGRIGDGPIRVTGEIGLPPVLTFSGLPKSRFDLTADLDPITVVIPDFIAAKLNGQLLLRNSESGGPLLKTAEGAPLMLSRGTVGIPPPGAKLAPTASLPLAPELNVRVLAGDDLRFRYRPVDAVIAPTSSVDIGGTLTRAGVTLHGEVQSSEGELTFPNARLDLLRGRASLERKPEQPMRVRVIEAEAVGTVGDYQVILAPTGQVYPAACDDPECVPLDLGIRTLPYLDPAYATALLIGPVVVPSVSAGPDAMRVWSAAQRPTLPGGAITGFMVPGLGTRNFGLDYAFQGPVSLRLRQRLFGTTYVQYVSPLSGTNATSRLALNYQVAPSYFVGAGVIWSPTALTQTLYQLNRFWTF